MMAKISDSSNVNMSPVMLSDAEVAATAQKKTKIKVAVAGALGVQADKDLPPARDYAASNVGNPVLTAAAQLQERVRQMQHDFPGLQSLLLSHLTTEVRVAIEQGNRSGVELLNALATPLEKFPALKQIVAQVQTDIAQVEHGVQNGTLSPAQATLQIMTAFDKAEASFGNINDQYVSGVLELEYHGDQLSNEVVMKAVNTQLQKTVAEAQIKAPTLNVEEQVSQLKKDLDAIMAKGTFDITAILIQLMAAMDQIRQLANKAKIREREATLTLQLASAQDTRDKGIEQMKAALISGILSMAAGVVSIVGSMRALSKANAAQNLAEDGAKKAAAKALKDIEDPVIAQEIKDAGSKAFNAKLGEVNGVTSGLAQLLKGAGDAGAGIQGIFVSNAEAAGKEKDAYAQAASSRSEAAAKMAEDMLQAIMKVIDNLMQLNNIINQGASNIIQKV
jgi:hypothetical protein